MRKGQESYRDGYEPVKKVSPRYLSVMRGIKEGTALRYLMELLADSPASVVVGRWERSDRMVHFIKPRGWAVGGRHAHTSAVPEVSVASAVGHLRKTFAENAIMYGVWQSNPKGNPRDGTGVEKCDLTVGLVRVREHVKISRRVRAGQIN